MKKILVIEDDRIMRENTSEILMISGYQVSTAENGKIGVELAETFRPDLIICDIMMPVMNGYEVLGNLSSNPMTAFIPFIFISAKTEKSEIRKGMELGADDYLTKPFDATELLNTVEIRIKKAEKMQMEFTRDETGLNLFLEEACATTQLQNLSKNSPAVKYKKKQVIFHSGATPEFVFFLNKGSVKTSKLNDEGKEFITSRYNPGDFFGHVSLFDQKPYTESAVAIEESELCKIPRKDFLSLINKNRDVSGKFIRILSNQIKEQETQLIRLAYDNVRKRTAEALLSLIKTEAMDGQRVAVKITREDLANMVGTATETVIRCLSEFREDALIEIDGREILILKKIQLEAVQ